MKVFCPDHACRFLGAWSLLLLSCISGSVLNFASSVREGAADRDVGSTLRTLVPLVSP